MDEQQRPPRATGRRFARDLRDLATTAAPAGLLPSVLVEIGLADACFPLDSPIGPIFVAYTAAGIAAVGQTADADAFAADYRRRFGRRVRPNPAPPVALARAVERRLRGEQAAISLDLRGLTEFARATLHKAAEVPRGEVRPYAWIAREIGHPGAVRAVGTALGHNPVPLLIPCHRIVLSDGRLGQYVFGGAAKRAALAAEGIQTERLEDLARARVRYHGDDTTRIYCFPTCHTARAIPDDHLVTFATDEAARKAGYRPCPDCRPALPS